MRLAQAACDLRVPVLGQVSEHIAHLVHLAALHHDLLAADIRFTMRPPGAS